VTNTETHLAERDPHEVFGRSRVEFGEQAGEEVELLLQAAGAARAGDTVRIMETRPLAKTVSWRVTEVVERAK
jgi:hypothetical protein